jgi:hypothetical protein
MDVKKRQRVERAIVRRAVRDLIAAGYKLNVDNGGEEFELPAPSASERAVVAAMFATDDEKVYAFKGGQNCGWVWFVYGNDGYDVICDSTISLAGVLKGAEELAERYEEVG